MINGRLEGDGAATVETMWVPASSLGNNVATFGFFKPNWFYLDSPWFYDGFGFFLVFFPQNPKFYKNSPRLNFFYKYLHK